MKILFNPPINNVVDEKKSAEEIWNKYSFDWLLSESYEDQKEITMRIMYKDNFIDALQEYKNLSSPLNVEEQKITHFQVGDNSDAFRNWLDALGVKYKPNGSFTSISIEEDIFRLGVEFALYKQKAQSEKVNVEEAAEAWAINNHHRYHTLATAMVESFKAGRNSTVDNKAIELLKNIVANDEVYNSGDIIKYLAEWQSLQQLK